MVECEVEEEINRLGDNLGILIPRLSPSQFFKPNLKVPIQTHFLKLSGREFQLADPLQTFLSQSDPGIGYDYLPSSPIIFQES